LDIECQWNTAFGSGEQALIAVARVLLAKPEFVFFDRLSVTLNAERAQHVLEETTKRGIGYLVFGKPEDDSDNFHARLNIRRDGSWEWIPRVTLPPA
jgi:putative ATP-binding cassette transporter